MNHPRTSTLILFLGGLALLAGCQSGKSQGEGKMTLSQKTDFGKTPDGQAIEQYTLRNKNGLTAKVMTYGATWTHMLTPDKGGQMGDILLGFDEPEPYLKGHPFFGSTTGRVANRIAKGKFTLDGKEYTLETNNGPNHLHGGRNAMDKKVWKAEQVPAKSGQAVKFTYRDLDGANGYPGNVDVTVVYTLTDDDELRIDYTATTDKPTPINLTNHAYFNLGTPASGDVLDHVLMLNCDRYTVADNTLIPTGEIAKVEGTPLDFTKPTPIGERIAQLYNTPFAGYDHNFVINGGDGLDLAARVTDPQTGRTMEIRTDQPGVQLYTANHLSNVKGKGAVTYNKHAAFCLETQHYPDSINKPQFPSVILRPGETYKTTTIHKFSVK